MSKITDGDKRLVTVCERCLTAACWRGIDMCEESRDADVVRLPVWRLDAMGREHPDYYAADENYPEPAS